MCSPCVVKNPFTMILPWLLLFYFFMVLTPFASVSAASASSYTSSSYTPGQKFNATCRIQEDCATSYSYQSYSTYLKCIQGLCQCSLHTFYDNYEKMCRIRVPSQCRIKSSASETVQPCVRFAQCAYPLDRDGNELKTSLQGTCQCLINRTPTQDGVCNGSAAIRASFGYLFVVLLTGFVIVGSKIPGTR